VGAKQIGKTYSGPGAASHRAIPVLNNLKSMGFKTRALQPCGKSAVPGDKGVLIFPGQLRSISIPCQRRGGLACLANDPKKRKTQV